MCDSVKEQGANWGNLVALRRENASFPLRKVDPSVHREPPHGWLLPYLLKGDDLTWRRWEWWGQQMARGTVGDDPIPEIEFEESPHAQTRKMLEQCLDAIPSHGAWNKWGGSQYFDYFLDWLLYGLGHKGQTEPHINGTMVKATLVNAAIFAPWMFRPFPFLDESLKTYTLPEPLIEHMVRLAELDEWQRICIPFPRGHALANAVMTTMDESCGLTIVEEGQELDAVPGMWDRVLLAPPLFNAQETEHVRAAYERLAPRGVLVVLVTGTWMRSEDERLTRFREWWHSLPEALRQFEPIEPDAVPDIPTFHGLGLVQLRKP